MTTRRLCQIDGLTEDQNEILKAVRQFVDEKIIPVATELEHADEYPQEIVDGLKELGVVGLMTPEEYDGLVKSLLTYAPCVGVLQRGGRAVVPHPRRLRLLQGVRDRAALPRAGVHADRRGSSDIPEMVIGRSVRKDYKLKG